MTAAAKIREVFTPASPDPQQVEEVAAFLRFSLGLNYLRSFQAVQAVIPTFSLDRYEELMMAVDNR